MVTAEQVRAVALEFPEAVEEEHHGQPDFRVRGKIFASFPSSDRVTVKLDPEHARALLESDPEAYVFHPGVWGQRGWIRIRLDCVDLETIRDLIEESWMDVAPRSLDRGLRID